MDGVGHFVEKLVRLGGQVFRGERLNLVDDEQGKFAPPLGCGQLVVFLEAEVDVIIVLAGQKLEAHPSPRIPAVDVKLHAVLAKHYVSLDRVAPLREQPRQEVAALHFGERVGHENEGSSVGHKRVQTPHTARAG